jgi:hypothetical protein
VCPKIKKTHLSKKLRKFFKRKIDKIRGKVQDSDYEITEYNAFMNAVAFPPVAHDIFDDLDGSYDEWTHTPH